MDEYLPMFLAEGREHLQELNLAVVRIEEKPDDPETVDEIFRIAHSMKGMSATMGFAGMAALTHEMEDVFELLRQRTGGLERAAIDVLFDSLDALSAAVEAIDTTGKEEINPEPLIQRLQSLVRERTPIQEAQRAGAAPPPDNLRELADGRRVVQVTAILNEDVSMPSVRAYMVLASLAEIGETLACRPSPDEVDTFDGREVDAWVVSDHTDGELASAASGVPEVEDVIVFEAVSDAALDEGEPDEPIAAVAPTPEPSAAPSVNGAPTETPVPANPVAEATAAAAKAAAQAPEPAARQQAAREVRRLLHGPRRRRAARSADALHGRARPAPHAGRGARRGRRRPRSLAGDAEPHALVARPAVDGHAGPDDPRGSGLPALPAARARPLDQALQSRSSSTWSARTPSSTARSSTRSATRSCTSCATRSTMASRAWRNAPRPASRRPGR